MLEQRIEQDIKAALLGGDKIRVTTLRGLKATLLNVKVATGKRETGLSDDEVLPVLAKEAKKRQESAEMYISGGAQERADAELLEKTVIEEYLPKQLSEAEIAELVDVIIKETGVSGLSALGQVIGQAKQRAGASADGSIIARIVKEKLA